MRELELENLTEYPRISSSVRSVWTYLTASLCYWVMGGGGLLTPLTFARHRLSPLDAFTSGAYFTMEGGDSEFANFTLITLKAFLEARSHNVSGNKQ